MNYSIESGVLADLPEIVALNQTIFAHTRSTEPYQMDEYTRCLQDEEYVMYVVRNDETEIIANAICIRRGDEWYVWIVGVHSEYRGRGIGSQLLAMAEQYGKTVHCKSITTKVYETSGAMRHLLEANEYEIVGSCNEGDAFYLYKKSL